jgi:hypothetical protein
MFAFIKELVKKLLVGEYSHVQTESVHKSKAESAREKILSSQFDHIKVDHQVNVKRKAFNALDLTKSTGSQHVEFSSVVSILLCASTDIVDLGYFPITLNTFRLDALSYVG